MNPLQSPRTKRANVKTLAISQTALPVSRDIIMKEQDPTNGCPHYPHGRLHSTRLLDPYHGFLISKHVLISSSKNYRKVHCSRNIGRSIVQHPPPSGANLAKKFRHHRHPRRFYRQSEVVILRLASYIDPHITLS